MKCRILFLCLIWGSISFAENSVTLYIIPPGRDISWKSPSAAMWTAFGSKVKSDYHPIGHVTAHLKCEEWEGFPSVHELTGATSDESIERELLFEKGSGVGILFYNFLGRLENFEEIWEDLHVGKELLGRLSTIRFLVNSEACHRMSRYLNEYREWGLGSHYGLHLRPRYKEGAGCTAFATSVLEVGGLLEADLKRAWSKTILAPESLIGQPVTDRFVSLSTILFSPEAKRWARKDEEHRELFFYDTQFMMLWLESIWKQGFSNFPPGYSMDEENYRRWHQKIWITVPAPGTPTGEETVYVSNGVKSLLIDARSKPTPTESIWLAN